MSKAHFGSADLPGVVMGLPEFAFDLYDKRS